MDQDENPLSRFLLLYKLVEKEAGKPIFYMQFYPGCGDSTSFTLLHEKRLDGKIKECLPKKNSLWSIFVDDGDILFIYAREIDFATAGGIWQVQWRSNENRYTLEEVTSSGIEMVEVKELLSDEELAFFEEAVAQAGKFLEAQESVSILSFVNGREIGASAPEKTHQVAPVPPIRTVEHTWHIALAGDSPSFIKDYLLEVVYHLQGEEWCHTVKVLEQWPVRLFPPE